MITPQSYRFNLSNGILSKPMLLDAYVSLAYRERQAKEMLRTSHCQDVWKSNYHKQAKRFNERRKNMLKMLPENIQRILIDEGNFELYGKHKIKDLLSSQFSTDIERMVASGKYTYLP